DPENAARARCRSASVEPRRAPTRRPRTLDPAVRRRIPCALPPADAPRNGSTVDRWTGLPCRARPQSAGPHRGRARAVNRKPVDLDAVMAEVRERIREKREKGIYGPDVEALLRVPLPGGRRIFADDLQDPLGSLAEALDADVEYDPRSRKPIVGPLITFARRVTIGLVKWWMGAI